jgi:prepilin peptidase CpaA
MTLPTMDFVIPGLLGLLLTAAVWQDVFRRRIPNAIVFPGTLLAFTLQSLLSGGLGPVQALAGLGVGLAAMLPLYLVRSLGAGDVKLMAMVGAFLGLRGAIGAVLFTWLAGMLLAVLVALRAGVLAKMGRNLRVIVQAFGAKLAAAEGPSFDSRVDSAARFPYSVAIALGSATFLVLKYLPS